MKTKLMYGVEHKYLDDDSSTFEIFETLDDALSFSLDQKNWSEKHKPTSIFKADFNQELIFKDKNNQWNYDDYANLILGDYEKIKTFAL